MHRWLLAATIVLLPPTALADDPAALWATTRDWQIRVDKTLGDGCFMVGSYLDGTILRAGLAPAFNASYLWVSNNKWKWVKDGEVYSIDIAFDRGTRSPWKAVGLVMDGIRFLMLPFPNEGVWRDISGGSILRLSHNGRTLTDLPLTKTAAAVSAIFTCQDTVVLKAANAGAPVEALAR